ncbi:hypothetical protein GCM10011571_32070 [Marinithermofilum abyssi]|uniref:Uncharacterized protein n=1 Tax=Marinithermofilum abyssi TaxID=1571185 RepID=A0A8J2YBA7_9BACL|nr:hypothetical protein GCM10011571_32070 [Marinithermofilum abyssi]
MVYPSESVGGISWSKKTAEAVGRSTGIAWNVRPFRDEDEEEKEGFYLEAYLDLLRSKRTRD